MTDSSEMLSNIELIERMATIERQMIKIQDEMPMARTGTVKSQWLIQKWHELTTQYSEVLEQAAERKLVTKH